MRLIEIIKTIDWDEEDNKVVAQCLIDDAVEYMRRVEAHIYKGNEIRADSFMDFSEKQEEIRTLDRKRTEAHNKMLTSFAPFLDILIEQSEFDKDDYMLENRTQIADFIATIAFEFVGVEPDSRTEGSIRDSLTEKLHNNEITYEKIAETIKREVYSK